MVTQSEILDSLEYVVRNSTFATIDKCAIENYVHNFVPTAVQHWSEAYPLGYQTQENSKDEIEAGSEMEVEIRANQLLSVHEIARKLKSAYPEITASAVQDILWLQSQDKSQLDKPYHLTRTIYY